MAYVAASHVEVHAVIAGLLRALRGIDVLADDVLDLRDGERPDHVAVEVRQAVDVDRRGPDRRPFEGGRMIVEERVARGDLGAKTSRGIYDYQGRSEVQILAKRDELYLKMLDYLESIGAFEPV